jgi:CHRD domain
VTRPIRWHRACPNRRPDRDPPAPGPGIDATIVDTGTPDAATADAAAADAGQAKTFTVTLSAAKEVPACPAAGPSAAGTATVTVSADNSKIELSLSYSGLSGAPSAGHIHVGAVGASGSVVLPFGGTLESPIVRTLTAANYNGAAAGAPATFAAFIDLLKAGGSYLNLHTAACAPGEIRAQIN